MKHQPLAVSNSGADWLQIESGTKGVPLWLMVQPPGGAKLDHETILAQGANLASCLLRSVTY
jgi:hypothetical protein